MDVQQILKKHMPDSFEANSTKEHLQLIILNGPNLNLLGTREPQKYGNQQLLDLYKHWAELVEQLGFELQDCQFIANDLDEANVYQQTLIFENEFVVLELACFQTNHEGDMLDFIHAQQELCQAGTAFFIVNPGAWGHTSVALRDALLGVDAKFYEVHITNVHGRESFRHKTFLQDIAQGVICGFGVKGYDYAIFQALDYLVGKEVN